MSEHEHLEEPTRLPSSAVADDAPPAADTQPEPAPEPKPRATPAGPTPEEAAAELRRQLDE
jgi:hypothetical protein